MQPDRNSHNVDAQTHVRGRSTSRFGAALAAGLLLFLVACGRDSGETAEPPIGSTSSSVPVTVEPWNASGRPQTRSQTTAAPGESPTSVGALPTSIDGSEPTAPTGQTNGTQSNGTGDDASGSSAGPGVVPRQGATASSGCGRPGSTGVIDLTSAQPDRDRLARMYVPSNYRASTPAPLILNLHGLMGFPSQQAAWSGFEDMAETEGFLTVAPQGVGLIPLWNAIGYPAAADDIRFLNDLLDDIEQRWCVDTSRIYVAGISNGGLMATYLACQNPDRFAAIAVVSGLRFDRSCTASPGVDLLVIYGTADGILPYTGGLGPTIQGLIAMQPLVEGVTLEEQAKVLAETTVDAVPESIAKFANLDRCQTPQESVVGQRDVILHSVYECQRGRLESYIIEGGGHNWPGTELKIAENLQVNAEQFLGYTSMELPASQLIWDFFRSTQ
ncbi:MAG: prolyl oligopeptidase family serine peptidase [Acidimicrobiia bacterium]|nr:prolyl oligopeptidase family serine peptidase [Acidimicrobiia bacterium]